MPRRMAGHRCVWAAALVPGGYLLSMSAGSLTSASLRARMESAPPELLSLRPPEGWWPAVVEHIGIELYRIPIVIASAALIYLAFLLIVRVFGARILSGSSGFDTVVIVMFGAVAGRVVLGHPPTVVAGLIGLLTLVAMEAVFGAVESSVRGRRILSAPPTVVFVHGQAVADACRRTHTSPADLQVVMRRAGVQSPADVQCIILESRGTYSLIREGAPIDPDLLSGVRGAERLT